MDFAALNVRDKASAAVASPLIGEMTSINDLQDAY
jgi:hypothetical protein